MNSVYKCLALGCLALCKYFPFFLSTTLKAAVWYKSDPLASSHQANSTACLNTPRKVSFLGTVISPCVPENITPNAWFSYKTYMAQTGTHFVLFCFSFSCLERLCANVWRTKISLSIKSLSLIKDKRRGKPKGSWFSFRNILLACCIYLLHKLMWFKEIKHFMNFFQRWLAKSFGNCCDHSEQNALHCAQRADAVGRLL